MAKNMACSCNAMCILSVMTLGLMILIPVTVSGISCGDAVSTMTPCGSFLMGAVSKASPECCASVQSLNKIVHDRASRQVVCECFKQVAPSFGVKPENAKLLPRLCKINLSLPGDPHLDCKRIN